jgi:hypothetical protein
LLFQKLKAGQMKANQERSRNNAGYSLVEVLASGVVFSLSVFMVCTMLWKGREIETSQAHFQRARAIVDSSLEDRSYYFSNYESMQGTSAQVVIDNNNGAAITGTLTVTVSPEQSFIGNETIPIVFKEVASQVTWNEPEGQQIYSISKRITRL